MKLKWLNKLLSILLVALIVLVLAAIIVPNFLKADISYSCDSNLHNMAVALEMYATDNQGHFPHSLDRLKGDYFRKIPVCPLAGDSKTFRYGYVYLDTKTFQAYTMYCPGRLHAGLRENYPQFSSSRGLILGR